MALFNTVCFPASVLELGIVKGPSGCMSSCVCADERPNCVPTALTDSSGTFNTLKPRTKTDSDCQSLLNFQPGETDVHVPSVYIEVRYALLCFGPTAIDLCPSLQHVTTQLGSSPGETKLRPVGPIWLTEMSRKSNALSSTDLYPF